MIWKFNVRAAVVVYVMLALVTAACSAAAAGAGAGGPVGPRGVSVDHPPAGALGPLTDFARCMRRHRVQMPGPIRWSGHRGRLTVYLPPHDRRTRGAYRACDHFRVLAKQKGGPH
jgi:hypothetical protein